MRGALAVATVLGLALGTAQAEEPKLSPAATIGYLAHEYNAAALLPQLAFRLDYRPPFLNVTWQERPRVSTDANPAVVQEGATIDLRYAHFDSWNDGRRDRNIMLVECWHYFPCYTDPAQQVSGGHGEIGYPVREFASDPIADALNHLAGFHEKERPKDPFESSGVSAASK